MTEMLRTLLCGALLITAIPALADDAPVSRVPRISDHPSDPVLKQLFDDTRARGGQILAAENARDDVADFRLGAVFHRDECIRGKEVLGRQLCTRDLHLPAVRIDKLDHRAQVLAFRRQHVLDARRMLAVPDTLDDTRPHEALQPFGQFPSGPDG